MVPDFSYSSSDEDEDYYDATEDISTMSSSQHHLQRQVFILNQFIIQWDLSNFIIP